MDDRQDPLITRPEAVFLFAAIILLLPESAFACGDPIILLVVGACVVFQILLSLVKILVRHTSWRERLMISGLYFISLFGLWIVAEIVSNWIVRSMEDYALMLILVGGPLASVGYLRWCLMRDR
jgi:hypothetical protein